MKNTAKRLTALSGSVVIGSLLLAGTAFADQPTTTNETGWHGEQHGRFAQLMAHRPITVGVVSAVNGSEITVDSNGFKQGAPTTTYSVDATNAAIYKDKATSSLGAIAVGDRIIIEGTVSGTTITATAIHDGVPGRDMRREHPQLLQFQGNGEPVVGGTIATINGSTITLTNKSNVTYTIDVTNASFTKQGATSTLGALAVGDNVLVQGTVNGTDITASSVLDQGVLPAGPNNPPANPGNGASASAPHGEPHHGFFEGVGNFFHRLFGFF